MIRKHQGLSLVELMISVALGLILMLGVIKIFVSSKVVFGTQQGLSRIQETGRLAIDFIARDVRMAGYYGASRRNNNPYALTVDPGVVPVGLHGNFDVTIMGYDSVNDVPTPSVSLGAMPSMPASGTTDTSNILVIRGAGQQGLVVTGNNTANSLFAFTTATVVDGSGCVDTICQSTAAVPSIAVATDPYKAYIFQVGAAGAGLTVNAANQQVTIAHPTNWGGDPRNPVTMFGLGAEILPVNTTVYFIAQGAGLLPSLFQKINTNNAVELLEGVERMRVTYSCSNNTTYRLASQVTASNDWANVQSVRIELVVMSMDNNVVTNTQSYTFATDKATPDTTTPIDKRMRQVFVTTIAPRSRMILN